MAQVVFAIFDERRGPTAVFSTIKDEILTKKVAVKSIVSTLTNVQGIQEEQIQGEAIIPFPTEGLIAFITYATLNQKTSGGENQVIALSVVTSDKDPSILYRKATDLSLSAREIRAVLDKKYKVGQALSQELKDLIIKWGSIIDEKPVAVKPEVTPKVTEKVIYKGKFSQLGLFQLFPVKKSLLTSQDPLAYGYFAILSKTPLLLVGSNVEFLLEVAEVFQRVFPEKELSIRLSIALPERKVASMRGRVEVGSSKIPRADIVVLNEEQYRKSFFYKDPIIVLNVNQQIETINFDPEKESLKALSNILKRARGFDDESLATNYLRGEMLSLENKLREIQSYCTSGRKMKIKDISKQFDTTTDYIFLILDIIRFRNLIPAVKINECFSNEIDLDQITIHAKQHVGFVR